MKKQEMQIVALAILILLLGCRKVDSKFYEDEYNEGLSIFSNRGNNIMTCKVANEPWITSNRELEGGFPTRPATFELHIGKESINSTGDFVGFIWPGKYAKSAIGSDKIAMHIKLPIPNSVLSLNQLNKQRIVLDTLNGFFRVGIAGNPIQTYRTKKPGVVFFATVQIDSLGPNSFKGKISGLFETHDNTLQISKGRFDHEIVPDLF